MQPFIWAILCTILMVGTIGLEIITPTFGVLTGLAVGFGVGSTILAFMDSQSMGFVFTALNVTLFPASFWLFFKWIGQSRMTSNADIQPVTSTEVTPAAPPNPLVGQFGKSLTPLRPGGQAFVDGKRIDVITQGKFIDVNRNLKVIKVSDGYVVVEEA